MTRRAWVLVIVSVLVSSILPGGWAFATGVEDRKKIVLFHSGILSTVQQTVITLSGSTVVHTLPFINALAIELPVLNPDWALDFLLNYTLPPLNIPVVEGIYDDLMVSVLPILPATPGELPPTEIYDWGLENIGADVAHQDMPTLTGAGVKVAILDTGVGPHPDLTIVDGFNALPGGIFYHDDHGHGTHMAGIIAARANGLGIIGAAPQASVVAVKVLDASGRGYLSDLIHGLQWIYNNQSQKQLRLVNMSLGFSEDSLPLQRAIHHLYERGIIMVASSGNSCSDSPGQEEGGGDEDEWETVCDAPQTTVKYPARYAEILAVTATDFDNQITDYSLAGLEVDIAAPGGVATGARILSTHLGGGYGYGSGTSQAAAHVTGALALKLQHQPQIYVGRVPELLQQTATNLGYPATQQGWGLIAVAPLLAASP